LDSFLTLLEASTLAGAIRASVWIYPTVNVLHVLGIVVLFAAIAAMDVRVLYHGARGSRAFIRRVRPWAAAGLVLMLATGVLLFVPEASHIADNPVFQIKLAAIAVALLNVGLFEITIRSNDIEAPSSGLMKASAAASLILWLSVAALGRLIAYF
jgi:hypothetical protein